MTFFLKADDGQCYWVHTQVGQGTAKVILEPTRTASESPNSNTTPTPKETP